MPQFNDGEVQQAFSTIMQAFSEKMNAKVIGLSSINFLVEGEKEEDFGPSAKTFKFDGENDQPQIGLRKCYRKNGRWVCY